MINLVVSGYYECPALQEIDFEAKHRKIDEIADYYQRCGFIEIPPHQFALRHIELVGYINDEGIENDLNLRYANYRFVSNANNKGIGNYGFSPIGESSMLLEQERQFAIEDKYVIQRHIFTKSVYVNPFYAKEFITPEMRITEAFPTLSIEHSPFHVRAIHNEGELPANYGDHFWNIKL